MSTGHAIDLGNEPRQLGAFAPRVANVAGLIGVVGVALGIVGGFLADWSVFFRAYILNYSYVLSLALGALFFVMLQHLTRAGWSATVRRLAEHVSATLPLLAVLFVPILIPVLFGMGDVYEWTNHETAPAGHRELLEHKAPYLNTGFFLGRCAFYFVVWILLARFFYRTSVAQDASGDVALTEKMQWWSAPGMLLYAITVTFFSVDVLMSINPLWFSTIWGVYFFSGAVVGFFSLLALLILTVQGRGLLRRAINVEHFHDVGKLAFAFVVFWAYIAFSQYMLIWYGNIPEETGWYLARQSSSWWVGVSLLLLFGHFVAPFLAMISRWTKRRRAPLALAGIWLLLMHWLDLYYIVVPRDPKLAEGLAPLNVADVALLFGLGGLFVFALFRQMGKASLLAEKDPWLPEALAFENV
jgi:hypothetical protein